MKTTIDLADDLVATIKAKSKEQGLSMRSVMHEALRLWLQKNEEPETRPKISREIGLVTGNGLSPEAANKSWEELRNLSDERGH